MRTLEKAAVATLLGIGGLFLCAQAFPPPVTSSTSTIYTAPQYFSAPVSADGGVSITNGALYAAPGSGGIVVDGGSYALCLNGNTCNDTIKFGAGGPAAIGVPSAGQWLDMVVGGIRAGIRVLYYDSFMGSTTGSADGTNDTSLWLYAPSTSSWGGITSVNAAGLALGTDNGPIQFNPGAGGIKGKWDSTGLVIGTTNASGISLSGKCTGTLDIASVSAQTCGGGNVTCTGAATGDPVACIFPSTAETTGNWACWVDATNRIRVQFCNPTSGAIDPASGTFGARFFH